MKGYMLQEFAMCLMCLSVLFPVSYLRSFRKKEWVSNFDKDEPKVMEDYENDGEIIYVYTLLGAILRSIGIAGIVDMIMLFTANIFWVYLIECMTLGMVWVFFGNQFGFSAFVGIVVGIRCFLNIRDRIRSWI